MDVLGGGGLWGRGLRRGGVGGLGYGGGRRWADGVGGYGGYFAGCRGPEADGVGLGVILELGEFIGVGDVGRVGGGEGVAGADEFGVDEGAVGEVDVAEESAEAVGFGDVFDEGDGLTGDELAVGFG